MSEASSCVSRHNLSRLAGRARRVWPFPEANSGGVVPVETWPRVAVLGAGAVGCYFGGMLARAGAPVVLIGRLPHVEALQRRGLLLESLHFQERIAVSASTEISAVREARVILLCVKTTDTETAAQSL